MSDLQRRFPDVHFYQPAMIEIQPNVRIGAGSRIGTFTLIHSGAVIGAGVTIGSHCNICTCSIGDRVSIQTGVHITRGVVIESDVFIGPGVVTLNDKLQGGGADSFPLIRHHAKIGGGTVILPGVTIGALSWSAQAASSPRTFPTG
jgi:UDP-2-acetamido-3-amino-2,3-dideoxy-glucuronate N-acetyltransferase